MSRNNAASKRILKEQSKKREQERKQWNQKISRRELQQIVTPLHHELTFVTNFLNQKFPGEMKSYLKELQEENKKKNAEQEVTTPTTVDDASGES